VTRTNPGHIGPVHSLTHAPCPVTRSRTPSTTCDSQPDNPGLGIRLRQERLPKPKPKISIVSYGTTTVTWFDSPLSRLPANACTETK